MKPHTLSSLSVCLSWHRQCSHPGWRLIRLASLYSSSQSPRQFTEPDPGRLTGERGGRCTRVLAIDLILSGGISSGSSGVSISKTRNWKATNLVTIALIMQVPQMIRTTMISSHPKLKKLCSRLVPQPVASTNGGVGLSIPHEIKKKLEVNFNESCPQIIRRGGSFSNTNWRNCGGSFCCLP